VSVGLTGGPPPLVRRPPPPEGRRVTRGTGWPRVVVALALLAVLIVTAGQARELRRNGFIPVDSEWLISYGGGFHRRGLFGSIYMVLFPDGTAGLWLLFALQTALWWLPLGYAVWWIHQCGYRWFALALTLSPGAFMFPVWDAGGFGRKGMLGLSALTLVAIAGRAHRPALRWLGVACAGLLFLVGAFSWEMTAVMLPAMIFLLRRVAGGRAQVALRAGFVAIGALGLLLGLAFPGTTGHRDAACSAVVAQGVTDQVCSGVLRYIGEPVATIRAEIAHAYPTYLVYIPLILLSVLPLATSRWMQRHAVLAGTSLLMIAPLFAVAVDYGRWTNVVVLELLICLMSSEHRPRSTLGWNAPLTVIYLGSWALPHWIHTSLGPMRWGGLIAVIAQLWSSG
jgi:hypothetical protein